MKVLKSARRKYTVRRSSLDHKFKSGHYRIGALVTDMHFGLGDAIWLDAVSVTKHPMLIMLPCRYLGMINAGDTADTTSWTIESAIQSINRLERRMKSRSLTIAKALGAKRIRDDYVGHMYGPMINAHNMKVTKDNLDAFESQVKKTEALANEAA